MYVLKPKKDSSGDVSVGQASFRCLEQAKNIQKQKNPAGGERIHLLVSHVTFHVQQTKLNFGLAAKAMGATKPFKPSTLNLIASLHCLMSGKRVFLMNPANFRLRIACRISNMVQQLLARTQTI